MGNVPQFEHVNTIRCSGILECQHVARSPAQKQTFLLNYVKEFVFYMICRANHYCANEQFNINPT